MLRPVPAIDRARRGRAQRAMAFFGLSWLALRGDDT
jgi:hypothetical protein